MRKTLALAAMLVLAGCVAPKSATKLQRYEFEEPQMGVPFRMLFYAADDRTANEAADAAFARIVQLNAIMSDYETDSEVSRLSRSSEEGAPWVPLSQDLWNVLSTAQTLARETDGAFDVTIGPCAALWRKARREKEFPDRNRLESARAKVGYRHLELDPSTRSARLTRFGMRLDLGGIAKGYAADQALKVLRARGIRSALVAASGDLALGDAPPGEKGWRVEIVGFDSPGGPPSMVTSLSNCGVSTSGDLFQRLEIEGIRYSHILNPLTCVGMTNHALATVVADEPMIADMLAKPMVILEPSESFKLAARYGVAARVVRLEKETPVPYRNRRFEKLRAVP